MHCAPALRALPQKTSTSDRLSNPVARIRYHVPLAPRSAATIETGPDKPEARKRAKAVSAEALSLNDPNCAAKAEAGAGAVTGAAFGAAGAGVLAGMTAGVATLVTTGTGLGAGAGAAGFTAAVVVVGLVGVAVAASRGGGFVAGAGAGTGAIAAGAALPSVNIGASAGFAG